MKQTKNADTRKLFEISWEACNQSGGIYTVIRSKCPSVSEYFGENYFAVGPYMEKAKAEFQHMEPPANEVGETIREMWEEGFDVHFGQWLITGKPQTVLFNIRSAYERMDDFKYYLWRECGVDGSHISPLAHDVIAFGYCTYVFFKKLAGKKGFFKGQVILQFHEWMAGVPIPFIKNEALPYKTVFTTHATLLGRYLAFNDPNYYDRLAYVDWFAEAVHFDILAEAQLERAGANYADSFTTVSRVMSRECVSLLGREPDHITPNGLNINKFSLSYKMEVKHQEEKQKIHQFVRGHFFGNYAFDLSRTLYFFTSGRYEYKNKGFDMTLEALARLNYKLRQIGSDVTVVMFIITNKPYYSLNPDVLHSRGIMEQLLKESAQLGQEVGEQLFRYISSHSKTLELPSLDNFVSETDRLRMKRTLQSWTTNVLPPVVTHNLVDDQKDEVLNFLRSSGLVNKPEDSVKIIYHPSFIARESPLFGMDYAEFVRGCHLGLFPSYYEPWGYTPLECLASGVPSLTSDLAGFGDYIENFTTGNEARGIKILKRTQRDFNDAAEEMANYLLRFSTSTSRERIVMRTAAEEFSVEFDWKNLVKYYFDVYDYLSK